jgi:hypothetical protein
MKLANGMCVVSSDGGWEYEIRPCAFNEIEFVRFSEKAFNPCAKITKSDTYATKR